MRKEESGVLPVWCPFYREDSGQGDWLGGEGANYLDMETGKVYQDMRAFSRGVHHASQQIFRTEFNLGEQAALVQQFHLHELRHF